MLLRFNLSAIRNRKGTVVEGIGTFGIGIWSTFPAFDTESCKEINRVKQSEPIAIAALTINARYSRLTKTLKHNLTCPANKSALINHESFLHSFNVVLIWSMISIFSIPTSKQEKSFKSYERSNDWRSFDHKAIHTHLYGEGDKH